MSKKMFRTWRAVVSAGIVLGVSAGFVAFAAQTKEEKKAQEKLEQAKRIEAQALVKLVDGAMTGEAVENAYTWTFASDFIKAEEGKTYVPFTLSFDPSTPAGLASLYYRVTAKGAQPIVPSKDKKKKGEEDPTYAFEQIYFVDLKAAGAGSGHVLRRAFAVPPGEYDVYVAIKERPAEVTEPKKGAPAVPVKMAVKKETISVPDFFSGALSTSSVIVAQKVEGLAAPLTPEQQAERPYAMGMTEITPVADMNFAKNESLSVLFLIYNPQLKDNKPDVTVEYSFHHVKAEGETKFNSTDPQSFNAQTLPPQFDLAAGHQLVAGQEIPLSSFPEGDYRMEITVKDNVSGKTLTRDRLFTVAAR